MRNIKRHRMILFGSVLLISVVAFIIISGKSDSIEDKYKRNPVIFETVSQVLCLKQSDAFPVLINEDNYVEKSASSSFINSITGELRDIFETTSCDIIFASETQQGTPYCIFTSHSLKAVTGIAFIDGKLDFEIIDSVFGSLLVNKYTVISDKWISFEYLTADGEKDVPG